jgi:hypothetical protein
MQTLLIRHEFSDQGKYYPTTFLTELFDRLEHIYKNIYNFKVVSSPEYEDNGLGSVFSCLNFSIINPYNDKYILISFFDNWRYHFMKHMGWKPEKMIQFFYPGGFNYQEYFYFKHLERDNKDIDCPINIEKIYNSFYYCPHNAGFEDYYTNLYENRYIENTTPELYFRGYMWDFRKDMVRELDDDSIKIIDKNNTEKDNLDYEHYLADSLGYRGVLSLPGGNEMCNRDIEGFAIGTPVFRPTISVQYEDPLISNYHYVSFYDNCKYWDGDPWYSSHDSFSKSLHDCWYRMKHNVQYLNFVASNARSWYLKNCTFENNMKYLITKLKLDQLFI